MSIIKKIICLTVFSGAHFLLLQQTNAAAPITKCDPIIISKETPEGIFQRITRLYIPVFSKDSYIKEEIKKEDFEQWTTLLNCLYAWIESSQIAHENYDYFQLLFLNYFEIADIIFDLAKKIHNKRSLPNYEINNLKKIAQQTLDEVRTISYIMLEIIANSIDVSTKWEKSVPSRLEKIFPIYTSFFKSYKFGKEAKANRMSDREFEAFLKINKIPITKTGLEDLLNTLEQFIYRLKHTKSIKPSQIALIFESQEISDRIINQFNQFKFFTKSLEDKLFRTSEKAALAAFAISDQYAGSLEKLIKDINSLIRK